MFTAQYVKDLDFIQKNDRRLRSQRTRRIHERQEVLIQDNIMNYFKDGGDSLLDESPPKKDHVQILKDNINSKGFSAVTFTFIQALRDKYSEEELRTYIVRTIRTICLNRDIPAEVVLIPDADEAGNFHYHGIISMPIKYRPAFKRLTLKYIGFMKFSYITDTDGWLEYCLKDIYDEHEINALGIYLKV